MARRRWNLVVNREPSFSLNSLTGEQLDVPGRGLLSRVMGVASRSRTAFPNAEVSLEREAALPVSSWTAPPLAFSKVMVSLESLTNLFVAWPSIFCR